jgi:predicted TIM-barrel fold metal-dependent hydrolase
LEKRLEKFQEIRSDHFDVWTDTREVLENAKRQAAASKLSDYVVVDIDSHHTEATSWTEVVEFIEDPVLRHEAINYHRVKPKGAPPFGTNNMLAYHQEVAGRIPHQAGRREATDAEDPDAHRDVILQQRAMECLGIDYMVLFPEQMLSLGMHPQIEMEVQLAQAYNSWMVERVLPGDDRLKSLLYLPFNDPEAALRTVEEFSEKKGVIGFIIATTRDNGVHENKYMKLYAALEERGLPLGFHGNYYWLNPSLAKLNRFIGVHSLGFVFWSLIHMTNWIINGLPERFPKLNVIWIESGLAWVPFLMQRLDNEFMMRNSEAPLLKRLPSEYMREMYFSSQPLEANNLRALEVTFEMINAETQLLYASDWPHWDFDLPSKILDLPFLSGQGKRNILGESALKLFKLKRPETKEKIPESPLRV